MDKRNEIRSAFKLWKRLLEMEALLWDHYNDEFLDLIKDNPLQSPLENLSDDPIPF